MLHENKVGTSGYSGLREGMAGKNRRKKRRQQGRMRVGKGVRRRLTRAHRFMAASKVLGEETANEGDASTSAGKQEERGTRG